MTAGDTRCGRQLLLEADADAARGLAAALEGGNDGGGGACEPDWRLIQAARAVAQRLRRFATICAAAASSAVPDSGRDQVKAELERCDPTAGMGAAAGEHPFTTTQTGRAIMHTHRLLDMPLSKVGKETASTLPCSYAPIEPRRAAVPRLITMAGV
jgi:hypothetical protein